MGRREVDHPPGGGDSNKMSSIFLIALSQEYDVDLFGICNDKFDLFVCHDSWFICNIQITARIYLEIGECAMKYIEFRNENNGLVVLSLPCGCCGKSFRCFWLKVITCFKWNPLEYAKFPEWQQRSCWLSKINSRFWCKLIHLKIIRQPLREYINIIVLYAGSDSLCKRIKESSARCLKL